MHSDFICKKILSEVQPIKSYFGKFFKTKSRKKGRFRFSVDNCEELITEVEEHTLIPVYRDAT